MQKKHLNGMCPKANGSSPNKKLSPTPNDNYSQPLIIIVKVVSWSLIEDPLAKF